MAKTILMVDDSSSLRTGIPFVGQRKQHPRHRFTPVNMLTTEVQAAKKEQGHAAGGKFRSLRGISGSTILGSGEVALIFDLVSLSQPAAEQPGSPPALRAKQAPSALP